MNTLRVFVADDEPPAREELLWILSHMEGVEIVGSAGSAAETLRGVQDTCPHAVFLDIHMPGATGLDLCTALRNLPDPPEIVLVTAYSQFAVQAFEAEALDYVLKPYAEERIRQTILRLRQRRDPLPNDIVGRIVAALQSRHDSISDRVPVESHGRILLLAPQEIMFCRSAHKRVMIHDRDGYYPAQGTATLDRLETQLAPFGFFRAHRTFLVNLHYVRAYSPWEGGRYVLVMDDHAATEIPVSRAQATEFKRRLRVIL